MVTRLVTFAEFCSVIRRKGTSAFCLLLCLLGLRVSANAQLAAPASNPKEIVLHNFVSPPHGAYPALGVIRDFAGNLYGTTNGAYSDIRGRGHKQRRSRVQNRYAR